METVVEAQGTDLIQKDTDVQAGDVAPRVYPPVLPLKKKVRRVTNPTGFATRWARKWKVPDELIDDLVQEAWVAALENDYSLREIVRAMDRFRKREYRKPMTITDVHDDLDASDWPLTAKVTRDNRPKARRIEAGKKGNKQNAVKNSLRPQISSHEQYHGSGCRDDV